jgi:hypothetical protein
MSTSTIPRSAGIGLLVAGIATFVGFAFSASPGGDYSGSDVVDYIAPGHAATAFAVWYVAALGSLALVVFGAGLRRLPGIGAPLSALATVGAALGVTGAWIAGGVAVATTEGGAAVRQGTPAAVVYVFTEIGHALAVSGPALAVGVIAIVLALRTAMPMWLRVVSVVGGVSGILAPFYFTYFLYLLVVLVLGVALVAGRAVRTRTTEPAASIV